MKHSRHAKFYGDIMTLLALVFSAVFSWIFIGGLVALFITIVATIGATFLSAAQESPNQRYWEER